MSYVVCLIKSRENLILVVYVYLFQYYYTGATTKIRLPDVVSV